MTTPATGQGGGEGGRIGVLGALSIGIGGIVGGGFFATFGLAVVGARGATWLSFLVGCAVALLTAYAYVGLTRRYPGPAGTIGFVRQAFGSGMFPASVSVLLVLSYVAVMAVYSVALGAYASARFPADERELWARVIASAAIVVLGLVNYGGPSLMARLEGAFNAGKLAVLAVFVVGGLSMGSLDWHRLGPAAWVSPTSIVANGMVVFLAYEGFELIANASERIDDPRRTLPVAYFGSVLGAMVVYVLATVVAVGHASFGVMEGARSFALSVAAESFLGGFGFWMLAVGAVLASASAVNADFFGAEKLPPYLAQHGQLPRAFAGIVRGRAVPSLVVIGGLSVLAVNLVGLPELSSATSAGFLVVFTAVNAAGVKLARETGSRAWISALAAVASLAALLVMVGELVSSPATRSSALAVAGIVAASVAVAGLSRLGHRGSPPAGAQMGS